jgi:hypothetical protein
MSGSTPFGPGGASGVADGFSKIFSKNKSTAATDKDGKPDVPQVPVERLVSSPRRQLGRGRRDTILTGADGI